MQRVRYLKSGWQLLKSSCEGAAKQANTQSSASRRYSHVSQRFVQTVLTRVEKGVLIESAVALHPISVLPVKEMYPDRRVFNLKLSKKNFNIFCSAIFDLKYKYSNLKFGNIR